MKTIKGSVLQKTTCKFWPGVYESTVPQKDLTLVKHVGLSVTMNDIPIVLYFDRFLSAKRCHCDLFCHLRKKWKSWSNIFNGWRINMRSGGMHATTCKVISPHHSLEQRFKGFEGNFWLPRYVWSSKSRLAADQEFMYIGSALLGSQSQEMHSVSVVREGSTTPGTVNHLVVRIANPPSPRLRQQNLGVQQGGGGLRSPSRSTVPKYKTLAAFARQACWQLAARLLVAECYSPLKPHLLALQSDFECLKGPIMFLFHLKTY